MAFLRQVIALVFVILTFSGPAFADGLFLPLNDQQAAQAARVGTPQLAVGRSRDVVLDAAYLAARIAPQGMDQAPNRLNRVPPPATVVIELFPGVTVALERTSITEAFGGGFVWTGQATGPVPASANLVIRNGHISGMISVMGRQPLNYRIDPLSIGGVHRISELDGRAYPREGHLDGHDANDTLLPDGGSTIATEDTIPARPDLPAPDAITQIDVLVAYTGAAAAAVSDIVAQANLAVSLANTGFTDSAVMIQYRLVGTIRVVNYAESDFETMLGDLTDGTLPSMQPVHAMRDSRGADLVGLLVNDTQYCGLGWRPEIPSAATADQGFTATAVSCITNQSFAHEFGHNMGLNHDRFVSPSAPASQYNFGYVDVPNQFRTIMGYNDQCGAASVYCTRINQFSNPSRTYEGHVTGIAAGTAGAADSARWLNEVRAIIAAYRATDGVGAPENDLFANRITITAPGTVTGTNVNASAEPGQPGIVFSLSTNAVWWRFTPAASGTLVVDTCGSDFDTTLSVYTGPAVNALTAVAEDDDSCGRQSRVTVNAVRGVEYQIGVAGFLNASGRIALNVAFTSNESATTTSLAAPSVGLLNEVLDFSATVTSPGGIPTGWLSFRMDGTEFALVSLDAAGNAATRNNTLPAGAHQITAYYLGDTGFQSSESEAQTLTITAKLSTTTTLAAPSTGVVGATLRFTAAVAASGGTPGGRVSFREDGIEFATALLNGNGRASVSRRAPSQGSYQITAHYLGNTAFEPSASVAQTLTIGPRPPRNNLFANRILIRRPGTVTGTNTGATSEPGQPSIGDPSSTNAVWWRFIPETDGMLTLDTCGSNFDTTLAVFSGSAVDALTTLIGNDDIEDGSACNRQSRVSLQVTAGFEYQIAVAGYLNRTGDITLNLAFSPQTPAVQQIAVGESHTCSTHVDQSVYCWGSNSNGQLGNGGTIGTASSNPVQVQLTHALQVAAGQNHSCAAHSNGRVSCWGANGSGQLGNRSIRDSAVPVGVTGVTRAVMVTAGRTHSCALRSNGRVLCWGANESGQLGDGTTVDRRRPVAVSGLGSALMIVAGADHTCALLTDQTVACWGDNSRGQIGDGTTTTRLTPVAVSRITDARQIAVGTDYSCAVLTGRTARCWGANDSGQIGDGTRRDRLRPTRMARLNQASLIAAGQGHTCAVRNNGQVMCVGANDMGQIGDGTTVERRRVVRVHAFDRGLHVAVGGGHSCAVQDTGVAYCWGRNDAGQLGDGTTTQRSVPVRVNVGPS